MPTNNNNDNSRRRSGAKPQIDTKYAHLQPQDIGLERVVLGALMVDSDAFSMVSEMLKPSTFYEPRHQKIYEAIQKMNMEERPVDIMTLVNELTKMGEIDRVGGAAYLMDISSQVASAAHIEYHARILAQKALQRQLIHYASDIETQAFDESVDVDELMQHAEAELFTLSQNNMKQDYTQIDPVIKDAVDILQRAAKNSGGLAGIPTGYTGLDDMTSGWQPSDLVIIAGRPAMGKTSFALSIAKNVAVDYHIPIGFFSLEMNNVQLVNRLISNVCEISGHKILNGQLDNTEWERLDRKLRDLTGAPIYVDDTPGLSVFELRTKARRLVREKGVKLLMIDYLQLMNANGMEADRNPIIYSHILGNTQCKGSFTHGRTSCDNHQIGSLPSGSDLIHSYITGRNTGKTSLVAGSSLQNFHSILYHRSHLRKVLLHVVLRNLEQGSFRLLHQFIHIHAAVIGFRFYVTSKMDQLSLHIFLRQDTGMRLHMGSRSHL